MGSKPSDKATFLIGATAAALPPPAAEGEGAKAGAPLADIAYLHIKQMLLVNELVAGQKIRYADVARRLGMSQTPVIIALSRLESEGLVRSEANKGFRVPELDLEELHELYQMRTLIEGWLVKMTAKSVTHAQLAELEGLLGEHRSVRGESYCRERLWCDARVHLALASFSGHGVGQQILRNIFDRLYLRYRPERLSSQRMQESEDEHQQVFEALEAREVRKASQLLQAHIERGRVRMLAGIKQDLERRENLQPWG
jgi:DNA-binding GntR family transcriptional regulator